MKHSSHRRLVHCLPLILLAGMVSGCALKERLYYAAPTLLPGTERSMKTAGFWEGRHPFPDRIILDREEILTLNRRIQNELKLTRDITCIASPLSGEKVRGMIEESITYHAGRHLYHEDGSTVTSRFYAEMAGYMNLQSEFDLRYGLIVRYTDQRVLPTAAPLYAKQHDRDFDALQNSALDIGTPVAVAHATPDGTWYYVIDHLNAGWVPAEAVALCTLEELRRFAAAEPFAVVTRAKGGLFRDAGMRVYHDYVRMGARLPLSGRDSRIATVRLPLRGEDGMLAEQAGYIREDDIHEGYLPYAPRTIIRQAFELLNAPYGWGGLYGEQDCSRFVQEIFATVGISLPRNSSKQAEVGELIGEYTDGAENERKRGTLSEQAIGGCTLLYLQGHIMLFLGM
ncbi:MAG: SH3 domain-containing protein, partial [Deltaproteobacteria bacterium]|nr:SH3 domain-containing protein [Deltaproteobacteria bacterium]